MARKATHEVTRTFKKGDYVKMNIRVYTKIRSYEFLDVKSWSVDELFLLIESKKGEKRFIKTENIDDFLVKETEESEEK